MVGFRGKLLMQRSKDYPIFDSPGLLWQTSFVRTVKGGPLMAMESHLAELERRHQALEYAIEDALHHPGTDNLELADLKKRKLQLKDEISRLRETSLH